MPIHRDMTGVQIHVAHAFEYSDATARKSASGFDAADKGKLALQLDNDSLWILTDYSTPNWTSIIGQSITPTVINLESEYNNGTISTNTTINWNNGINQVVILGANITLSFSNIGIGHKQLRIVQDNTGNRIPTLPNGLWPGGATRSFSTAANTEDILSIFYNGTNYYYQLSKGWG